MRVDLFVRAVDTRRVREAVAAVARRSRGEVQVYVTGRLPDRVDLDGRRRLAAWQASDPRVPEEVVLLYVAPAANCFSVVASPAAYEPCGGAPFWEEVSRRLEEGFRRRDYAESLAAAVETIGERLAERFPADGAEPLPGT